MSPLSSVSSSGLPGIKINVQGHKVALTDIFVSQMWPSTGSSALSQLAVQQIFWYSTIKHPDHLTNHRKRLCFSSVNMEGMFALCGMALFEVLSCHVMFKMNLPLSPSQSMNLRLCTSSLTWDSPSPTAYT